MKLTIEVDDEFSTMAEHDIRTVLMDALYEFVSHRGPSPDAYVMRRYPDESVYNYGSENRTKKIEQVSRRVKVAETLHRGIATLEVSK